MKRTEEAIAAARDAFRDVPRPTRFIRGTCACDECLEHDETLASHTPDTITMAELGHPSWDPMCAASDQAFAYYLPAMIRLALEEGYWDQLLFHLNAPGRVDSLNREQARALLAALWVLAETKLDEIARTLDIYRLEEAIHRLEAAGAADD